MAAGCPNLALRLYSTLILYRDHPSPELLRARGKIKEGFFNRELVFDSGVFWRYCDFSLTTGTSYPHKGRLAPFVVDALAEIKSEFPSSKGSISAI